jgi:tRNA(Ile)-lysidine synthase
MPSPEQIRRFAADIEALTGPVPPGPAPPGPAPARLGLAVSGGPDSLALLLLANAAFPGRIAAATVDHGLRAESAAEAAFVADLCGRLAIPHQTLLLPGPIAGNVQAGARAIRYALLGRWLAETGGAFLLTAHHCDDQAETLVMRLLRGSGLAGLAGIRPGPTILAGAAVLRPLLGWRRAELGAIVAAAGIVPVDDPSNGDEHYDRARIRKRLAAALWLEPEPLARSAAALAEAEAALDWAANRLFDERVTRAGGETRLDPAGLPDELRRRLVLRILAAAEPPRGAALQRLLASLDAGATATLAGVKCVGGPLWRFIPAPQRRGQST